MEAFRFLLPHRWNLPVYASLIYFALVRGLPRLSKFYVILPRWWNMPLYIAVLYIGATRDHLSQHNLYDTYLPAPGERPIVSCDGINPGARTLSGICNSLGIPEMGSAGSRYARFVPINRTYGETDTLHTPNPRAISQHLLKRESFKPATSINNLAAAWIQFQTHDWFSHATVNDPEDVMSFPLPENDPLRATGETHMSVPRMKKDTHPDRPVTYNNSNTHWWDLSQVYGADEAKHATLRSFVDGKMKVAADGLIPVGPDGLDITGDSADWWAGLSLIHNIWVKEHNLACDIYPQWNDTQLFDRARLVTTALNAKIPTIEWTPALLQDKILQVAMNTNWKGLAPKWLQFLPNIFSQHVAEAYYGTSPAYPSHTAKSFHADNSETENTYTIPEYAFGGAQDVVRGNNFSDVVYTFGTDNPGALVLGNYPAAMRSLAVPGTTTTRSLMDMGVIDTLRDRERGVPRYNEFRRLFSLIPAKTMDDISDDRAAVDALRSIYGEDVENTRSNLEYHHI
ncbi:heme peroxidase [Mycena vitilis]|nr:heme peroxidase [Mycena vitilis]